MSEKQLAHNRSMWTEEARKKMSEIKRRQHQERQQIKMTTTSDNTFDDVEIQLSGSGDSLVQESTGDE